MFFFFSGTYQSQDWPLRGDLQRPPKKYNNPQILSSKLTWTWGSEDAGDLPLAGAEEGVEAGLLDAARCQKWVSDSVRWS